MAELSERIRKAIREQVSRAFHEDEEFLKWKAEVIKARELYEQLLKEQGVKKTNTGFECAPGTRMLRRK